MHRHKIISWQAPDHDLPEKPLDWFISVTVVGVAITIASLFVSNITFAIFSFVATISIIIHIGKKPELIDIHLTPDGVEIRHDFYPYRKLHSFWIDREKDNPELILHSDRTVLPHIIVPLRDINPEYVRAELRQHITERYAHKNLVDKFLEYLGF
ncbi:MAG: hypothetical protein HY226_02680 [Candidatus Vogelbacteria bacterium]|nr:hypothetical protein [Candidatus Vogelbacteria bacterium]